MDYIHEDKHVIALENQCLGGKRRLKRTIFFFCLHPACPAATGPDTGETKTERTTPPDKRTSAINCGANPGACVGCAYTLITTTCVPEYTSPAATGEEKESTKEVMRVTEHSPNKMHPLTMSSQRLFEKEEYDERLFSRVPKEEERQKDTLLCFNRRATPISMSARPTAHPTEERETHAIAQGDRGAAREEEEAFEKNGEKKMKTKKKKKRKNENGRKHLFKPAHKPLLQAIGTRLVERTP